MRLQGHEQELRSVSEPAREAGKGEEDARPSDSDGQGAYQPQEGAPVAPPLGKEPGKRFLSLQVGVCVTCVRMRGRVFDLPAATGPGE